MGGNCNIYGKKAMHHSKNTNTPTNKDLAEQWGKKKKNLIREFLLWLSG